MYKRQVLGSDGFSLIKDFEINSGTAESLQSTGGVIYNGVIKSTNITRSGLIANAQECYNLKCHNTGTGWGVQLFNNTVVSSQKIHNIKTYSDADYSLYLTASVGKLVIQDSSATCYYNNVNGHSVFIANSTCLLYTSPSPRD